MEYTNLMKKNELDLVKVEKFFQQQKQEVIKKSVEYRSLPDEVKREIDDLRIERTESQYNGDIDAVIVVFKTTKVEYVVCVAKTMDKDGEISNEYTGYGLNTLEVIDGFNRIGNKTYMYDVFKEVIINMLSDVNYKFFKEEKKKNQE